MFVGLRRLILLLLVGCFSCLQPAQCAQRSFEKYLYYINKAEAELMGEHFKVASKYYDSALIVWTHPFAQDLVNQLICASHDSDYASVHYCARKLIHLGCPLSFFVKPTYLNGFRNTRYFKILIWEYSKFRPEFTHKNNWNMRTQIELLVATDELNVIQAQANKSNYTGDDTVRETLDRLFKNGYPNEYDYGVFMRDDTTIATEDPLLPVLAHNYGKYDTIGLTDTTRKWHDYTQLLSEGITKGTLHPEAFAWLNDKAGIYKQGAGFGEYDVLVLGDDKKYYTPIHDSAMAVSIDSNRLRLGLLPHSAQLTKMEYALKHQKAFTYLRHPTVFLHRKMGDAEDKTLYQETGLKED